MARGPKRKLDEQIKNVNDQIEKTRKRLEDLIEQKESLVQQKREEAISRLYDLMMESGISVEELEKCILGQADSKETA